MEHGIKLMDTQIENFGNLESKANLVYYHLTFFLPYTLLKLLHHIIKKEFTKMSITKTK